jgi:prohibitin 2
MQDYVERLQAVARQSRGRFGGFGGGPGGPGGPGGAIIALAALAFGGVVLVQNSLFNVDGGHRAIKYKRISGVGKEIFSEGTWMFMANLELELRSAPAGTAS